MTLVACAEEGDEEVLRDPDTTEERSSSSVDDTSTTSITTTTLPGVPPWDGDDGFYAVLSTQPQPCPPASEPGGLSRVPGVDGTCHDLNLDTELDVEIVESADVEIDEQVGTPQVALVFTEDGIERFNVLASECYLVSEVCPTGQVAIVANGYVVSAPAIEAPTFQRDQIIISNAGAMTEDEAEAIAAALDG